MLDEETCLHQTHGMHCKRSIYLAFCPSFSRSLAFGLSCSLSKETVTLFPLLKGIIGGWINFNCQHNAGSFSFSSIQSVIRRVYTVQMANKQTSQQMNWCESIHFFCTILCVFFFLVCIVLVLNLIDFSMCVMVFTRTSDAIFYCCTLELCFSIVRDREKLMPIMYAIRVYVSIKTVSIAYKRRDSMWVIKNAI